jgi:hypothetical protein
MNISGLDGWTYIRARNRAEWQVDTYAIASFGGKCDEQILRILEDVDMFYSAPDGDWVRIVTIGHNSRVFDRYG